jgi:hypothetical protein
MRARLEVFAILPRIEMELYGQAQPKAYGDSIIRGGSQSGLSGTLRPAPLRRLDLALKDLVYLLPGTRHFKTAGSNLSVEALTWEPDRTVLTAPVTPPTSGSGGGSAERLPAYAVTTKNLQMIDRNNSVWVSPLSKPVVMRVPKDSLRDDPNTAPPAGSETYDINPFRMAELVDREGNIWFGDSRGIHRLFYTPLIRQELPKQMSGSEDFAVVADDNGAVWISFNTGNTLKADLMAVGHLTVAATILQRQGA